MKKIQTKRNYEKILEQRKQDIELANKPGILKKLLNIIAILNYSLGQNKYFAYIIVLSFPLFVSLIIYLVPYPPNIPASSALKQISGKFDYISSDKNKKYGK